MNKETEEFKRSLQFTQQSDQDKIEYFNKRIIILSKINKFGSSKRVGSKRASFECSFGKILILCMPLIITTH